MKVRFVCRCSDIMVTDSETLFNFISLFPLAAGDRRIRWQDAVFASLHWYSDDETKGFDALKPNAHRLQDSETV